MIKSEMKKESRRMKRRRVISGLDREITTSLGDISPITPKTEHLQDKISMNGAGENLETIEENSDDEDYALETPENMCT